MGKGRREGNEGVGKELRSVSVSLFQRVGAALRNDLAHECFFVCVLTEPKDA